MHARVELFVSRLLGRLGVCGGETTCVEHREAAQDSVQRLVHKRNMMRQFKAQCMQLESIRSGDSFAC